MGALQPVLLVLLVALVGFLLWQLNRLLRGDFDAAIGEGARRFIKSPIVRHLTIPVVGIAIGVAITLLWLT